MTENIGVYSIQFPPSKKLYIGASLNLNKRFNDHLSALKRGNHSNILLQTEYNKGIEPVFQILKICSYEEIFLVEKEYIKKYNSYKEGFNLTTGGEGGPPGELNGNAKYNEEDYYKVLVLLANTDLSYSKIKEITEVSLDIIKKISTLKAHNYLELKYPEEYSKLKEKAFTRDNSAKSKGIVYPTVISPIGEEHSVENIHQFAKEHGLQYQNLHKVLTGQRNSHKGWKLKCK